MSIDFPEFGVDFEAGTITQPESTTDSTDRAIPDDDDDEAGSLPAPTPPAKAAAPDQIPRYRLDEVTTALRSSQEREGQLMALLQRLSTPPAAPAPPAGHAPPSAADAARERIRNQLFEVVPEFKKFLEIQDKLPALLSAGEAIPRLQEDTTRYWANVADTTLASVGAALGKALNTTIDPNSRIGRIVAQSFFEYVATDPRLVARYEAQDARLISEFLAAFEKDVFVPVRANAVAQKRQDLTRRLPVAGRTSAPPSQGVPKHNTDEDEDAVYKTGWDLVENARRSMTP